MRDGEVTREELQAFVKSQSERSPESQSGIGESSASNIDCKIVFQVFAITLMIKSSRLMARAFAFRGIPQIGTQTVQTSLSGGTSGTANNRGICGYVLEPSMDRSRLLNDILMLIRMHKFRFHRIYSPEPTAQTNPSTYKFGIAGHWIRMVFRN